MRLAWISADEWRQALEEVGFEVEQVYGWFDYRPFTRQEDMIFVARARPVESLDFQRLLSRAARCAA